MTNLKEDVEKESGCLPTLVRSTVGNALTAVFAPIVRKASRQDKKNEEGIRLYFQDVLEKIPLFKIGFMGKKLEDRAAKLLDAKIKSACRMMGAAGVRPTKRSNQTAVERRFFLL